jgi:hypothetical protein
MARLRASGAERERFIKRLGAGAAVALVHLLFLLILLTASRVGEVARKPEPREVLLLLPPLSSQTRPIRPTTPLPQSRPETTPPSVTITLPPPPTTTQKPGDVMQAIGKELACGAGSYENLTQAQREACKRQPWRFKKNAKGVIVLDALPPPPPASLSGAEEETHIQQTTDPCVAAGNTHSECIHKTIFGR